MFQQVASDPGVPFDLRVDGRRSPVLAVADATPRLAWRMPAQIGQGHGLTVEAAGSPEELAAGTLLWDADLDLDQIAVEWDGAPLPARKQIAWRVGVRQGDSRVSWSEPALFETAPGPADWVAAWITSPAWADPAAGYDGPPPVVGRDFGIPGPPRRARLYAATAGVLEVTINGRPISEDVLGIGYAVTGKRLPAQVWDVTGVLTQGDNRIRVTVAPGPAWVAPVEDRYTKGTTAASPPTLLLQLEVELEDGTALTIASGPDWSATSGQILLSHWYGGEDADGRIGHVEQPIAAGLWTPAAVVGDHTDHPLWWPMRPPLRVVDTLPGVLLSASAERLVFDVGTNVAGWPVLQLTGAVPGQRLEVRPAELLDAAGEIDQRSSGSPVWDSYTARAGDQTWHPRHVYHGFRYLEVRGAEPDQLAVEAWIIRADNQPVGELAIGDPFWHTLHTIIDRSVQSNSYSVFTDCPNREKLGWIEQLHLCFGLLTRLYDVEAHLRDSLALMRDAQHTDGLIPSIVPQTFDFAGIAFGGDPTGFVDDVNWGGGIVLLPLLHFRHYGDPRVLRENQPAVERYLAHLDRRSSGGLLDFGLGDWIAIDESTPRAMVATHGYLHVLRAAADIRRILGLGTGELDARIAEVLDAFSRTFGDADGLGWGSGSQASLALALDAGAVPDGDLQAVLAALDRAIAETGGRLTVGENSWPALVRVLHRAGRDQTVQELVRADDGPGYGLQIRLGATSLTETWHGAAGVTQENSQNHFMLGMIHDWITESLVGLAPTPDSLAWSAATVSPSAAGNLTAAGFSCLTPRGRYSVQWSVEPDLECVVEVPVGGRVLAQPPHRRETAAHPGETLTSGIWRWVV